MTDFTLTRKASTDLQWNLSLQLLTPMVGGGAVARMVDEDLPVSGKTVRGQLRFWWRATRGGRYGPDGLAQMKRDEEWLFGKAATFKEADKKAGLGPSRVQVRVNIGRKGRIETFDKKRTNVPTYAAFSLDTSSTLLRELEFDVQISAIRLEGGPLIAEDVKADLDAAIWAWVTFGGVGARTRRGFGALAQRGEVATEQQIRQGVKAHVLEGEAPKGVSQLSREEKDTVLLNAGEENPWYKGIGSYQEYRSYRDYEGKIPHRSYWPEPDEIRRLTGDSSKGHAKSVTDARKFPRAVFGLPIIFHFRNDGDRRGEPADSTLRGKETDRLASPLIIRPVSNKLLLAMILKINNHSDNPLNSLILQAKVKGQNKNFDVRHQLTVEEVNELRSKQPEEHLDLPQFAPDILATFLAFLRGDKA